MKIYQNYNKLLLYIRTHDAALSTAWAKTLKLYTACNMTYKKGAFGKFISYYIAGNDRKNKKEGVFVNNYRVALRFNQMVQIIVMMQRFIQYCYQIVGETRTNYIYLTNVTFFLSDRHSWQKINIQLKNFATFFNIFQPWLFFFSLVQS